jgi:hypothetical protein
MAAVSLASLVDPEIFLHVIWVEGDVWKSDHIRTGFRTPFVDQRLRAVGVRGEVIVPGVWSPLPVIASSRL